MLLSISLKAPGNPMYATARSNATTIVFLASCVLASFATPAFAVDGVQRSMDELKPAVIAHLGKTADWVAIAPHALWVGSTGPNAVNRIDPKTNTVTASVKLDGEPCSGLATGFGSLWVPLCGKQPMLAKVDLKTGTLNEVFKVGPAQNEGGVATSSDSLWLVIDKTGTLVRIDPATGTIRQKIQVPPGSYNPRYSDGQIWVTRTDGSEITSIDAATGAKIATIATAPGPHFLTDGDGVVDTRSGRRNPDARGHPHQSHEHHPSGNAWSRRRHRLLPRNDLDDGHEDSPLCRRCRQQQTPVPMERARRRFAGSWLWCDLVDRLSPGDGFADRGEGCAGTVPAGKT